MDNKSFNLISQSWIKVIDFNNQEQMVSLNTLFKHAKEYRQLAGDMRAQDLAILRFLLAILFSIYLRWDADGEEYDGLNLDDNLVAHPDDNFDLDDVEDTWANLYEKQSFTPKLFEYLNDFKGRFDLFDKENPFYQVSKKTYDSLVPANKTVAKGKGTVAIKQMNRTISESNNSAAVFTPRTEYYKNQISYAELTRWLITYQNFTGVTDKTKVVSKEKFSVSSGWLYTINPVFVQGQNLFETLLLNLNLFAGKGNNDEYHAPKPVWEYENINDYITRRVQNIFPDNLAELYTVWSRMLHIEWHDGIPTVFTAGLPKLDNSNAFLEPMTTWKKPKDDYLPETKWIKSMGKAMWRNFGEYVGINDDNNIRKPGIVSWVQNLKDDGLIPEDYKIHLATIGLISDGNATSQSPSAEVVDDFSVRANVLFDPDPVKAQRWPVLIEDTVKLTQQIGNNLFHFAKRIGNLRNMNDPNEFANRISTEFYDELNSPFLSWLDSLQNNEDRDAKISIWKSTLYKIAIGKSKDLIEDSSMRDLIGVKEKNIFVFFNQFAYTVNKKLNN